MKGFMSRDDVSPHVRIKALEMTLSTQTTPFVDTFQQVIDLLLFYSSLLCLFISFPHERRVLQGKLVFLPRKSIRLMSQMLSLGFVPTIGEKPPLRRMPWHPWLNWTAISVVVMILIDSGDQMFWESLMKSLMHPLKFGCRWVNDCNRLFFFRVAFHSIFIRCSFDTL